MNKVFFGDCRETMKRLIAEGVKVQTCVTSPPYWGLRDYGNYPTIWGGDPNCVHEWGMVEVGFRNSTKGNSGSTTASDPNHALGARFDSSHQWCQRCGAWLGCFGLEPTPELYAEHSVEVFGLVHDLLSEDGTLWLNLGDTYAAARSYQVPDKKIGHTVPPGLKQKDLIGIPWLIAFALRSAGWYLRCDIIWHKPNPMPESVTDRPTKSHEYIFLLSKNEKYYYDHEAIKEPAQGWNGSKFEDGKNAIIHPNVGKKRKPAGWDTGAGSHGSFHREGRAKEVEYTDGICEKRNKRSVWTIPTQPYPEAHFATFPPALIEPCILAGSSPGDIVFDPFFGSGTTGQVAEQLGRQWIGCEIQTDYEPLQKQRTAQKGLVL